VFGFFRKKRPEIPQVPDYFNAPGPDFSTVDSQAKAEEMFARGDLEKLFLLAPEFGGPDAAHNVLFVPVGLANIKAGVDMNILAPLIAEGKVSQYKATPKYQGDSFIPISIEIRAWNPGEFTMTINIWGEALNARPR
jgi:hypothetical protein